MKRISHFFVLLLCALLLFSLFSCGECEHEWNEATCTTAKTCMKCGITEGDPLGHSWKEATCTTAKTCTKCGITEGDPLSHTFGEWVTEKEPTESEEGTKVRSCTRAGCSYVERKNIPTLSHTHHFSQRITNDDTLATKATCTASATYYYSCTCGEMGSETFSDGDPLGHSFTNYFSNSNATCTKDGTKTAKCDRCNAVSTVTDTGSKIPHTFNRRVVEEQYLAAPATCTASATYYYSCVCGERGSVTFSDGGPLGHSFTNYLPDGNATCTKDGTKTAKCDRCNAVSTVTDTGSKIPHTFDRQIAEERYLATPATCTASATYYYSCVCGERGSTTFTHGNLLPHTFDRQVAEEKYLASAATKESAATYYYSCVCGKKGTETFTYGDSLPVEIKVYIDNQYAYSIYTSSQKGYTIDPPEKPEDIFTNPNSEFYFDGWYVDPALKTPLTAEHRFLSGGKIYARKVTVYTSSFMYRVYAGKAYVTGLPQLSETNETTLVIPAYINGFEVEGIDESAFAGNTLLRTIVLCNGIKSIGKGAFV